MLSPYRLITMLLICLCVPFVVAAETDSLSSPKQKFRAGIEAFQNNNLERARELLEAAAEDMESRALTYNLGVLYFKMGDYVSAEEMFRRLLDTPQRALAFYNLGLIALAQDQTSKARQAFREAALASSEDNLSKLARGQLAKLGAPPAPDRWQALLSLSAGYEDNIALFPDSAASSLDGAFFESVNAISGYPFRSGDQSIKTDLQLYGREYTTQEDFNTHLVRLNVAGVHAPGNYRLSLGIGGDQVWQGGKSRENRARLSSGLRKSGCTLGSETAVCSISVDAEQVNAADRYRAYDGQHYRLDTRYQARRHSWRASVKYQVDYDDRRNLDTGTEYYSVSPLGQTLALGLGYALTPALELGTSASYRFNYYRTPHRLEVPEGLLIIRREDQRLTFSIDGEYRVNTTVSLLLNLQQVQNDSNIARYDYDRRTATLGVAVRL
ncbi:tetratricopeptide repeat protein [Marinobacter sp. M216]|uniref:Tetratricopeptide repeat protein n=1 Tax=Marinobacter albus TaxID=3030833 RepID=A0ABT7HGG8_9GAMM|nr:tetratricopeptide repeat protein [Marinobacter sp. M216]MDK9558565.1 tetratricopeptide repeat protein [Marinobacter sp. M216]